MHSERSETQRSWRARGSPEAMLADAVSRSPVIFYVAELSETPGFRFISPNVETITGHTIEAFMSNSGLWQERVHPDDRGAFTAAEKSLQATGSASREYRFSAANGDELWFRDELRIDPSGRPDEIVGCIFEIGDRKRGEMDLRDREALHAAISEAALNAIVVFDESGAILDFNSLAERTFGQGRAQAVGRSVGMLFSAGRENGSLSSDAVERIIGAGSTSRLNQVVEIEATRADGSAFPAEAKFTAVALANRTVYVAELWDTTEHLRARQERERLLGLLHDAVQSMPMAFAIYDAFNHLILCNATYAEFFDGDPMSLIGTDAMSNHRHALSQLQRWDGGPVDRSPEGVAQSFARLHDAAGEPIEMQLSDGRWMQVTTHPTADGGRVFVRTDITRVRQREADLREAQEILEDAIESLIEGFALYDADDRLVMCNQRYRDLNKPSADLLVPGVRWADFVRAGAERGQYPDAAGRVDEWLAVRADQRAQLLTNVEIRQSDGSWQQFSNVRTRNGGTVVTRSDITHHKEMQKRLQENEALIRQVVESYPLPVVMSRAADDRVIYESPSVETLLGDPPTGNGQRVPHAYFVHGQRLEFLARLREHGAVDDFEVEIMKADGIFFWASICSRLVDYKGEEAIVSTIQDLSERRAVEAELTRHREALHQSEKLGALGSLLASVAHELNNPLSVVVGQALLLQKTASDPKTLDRATKIGNAADRCSRIVRTFLAMARQQPTECAAVDLNDIVEATLEVTGYSLRTAGIDLTLDLAPELPAVWADADQLNQVVTNLIVNAQQAMAGTTRDPRLKIASAFDERHEVVLVSVSDNGPGIPPEIQSRIFEPFFTTKEVGAGTGVGLAVCHKIMEGLRGAITVNSAPGEGATFVVSLPVANAANRVAAVSGESRRWSGPCKVLVIDDEPEVTRTVHEILSAAGHAVATADSGNRALKLLSRQEFDVILSDLRMPNMDGPQLYETLRELSPKMTGRIAFITGDTFSPEVSAFLKRTGRPYAQKPFAPGELEDLVDEVLAGARIANLGL